jgi:hypothetical protein
MHREFETDAAGRIDALAGALGEFDMMAVAGRKIGTGLGLPERSSAGVMP